jgi:hypothetical protein
MAKLEYFIQKLPKQLVKDFGEQLVHRPRQKDQVLGQLWDLILVGVVEKTELYARLYPGKPYHEKQIRNLRSDLFQRLLDFLVDDELRVSPEKQVLLAKAMNRYGITEYFPALAQKMETQLDNIGMGVFVAESRATLTYEIEQNKFQVDGRKGIDFPKIIAGYEEVYVLRVLYLSMAWQSHRNMVGETSFYQSVLLPTILSEIKAGRFAHFPLVELYYQLLLLQQNPTQHEAFFEARRLILIQGPRMEAQNLKELYLLLVNYSIQKMNQGQETFIQETYSLYLEMLDLGLIGTHNMSAFQFKTIVTAGLKLGKCTEVAELIETYAPHLPSKYRDPCLLYGRGLLRYYQKEYAQAEGLLNRVLIDFEDPFLGMDVRGYLMQIYYETKDDIGMESMPDAFRKYLKRHRKISPARRKTYEDYIRFYRRLVRLKPGHVAQWEKLRSDILACVNGTARSWLLEKMQDLLQKV